MLPVELLDWNCTALHCAPEEQDSGTNEFCRVGGTGIRCNSTDDTSEDCICAFGYYPDSEGICQGI